MGIGSLRVGDGRDGRCKGPLVPLWWGVGSPNHWGELAYLEQENWEEIHRTKQENYEFAFAGKY